MHRSQAPCHAWPGEPRSPSFHSHLFYVPAVAVATVLDGITVWTGVGLFLSGLVALFAALVLIDDDPWR